MTTENHLKAKTLEQGLRKEEEEIDYDAVQGESNAEKETPVKETPTGETGTREEDNIEALFLQMMLTESKEKNDVRPRFLFGDSEEQSLQEGTLEEEGLKEDKCDKRQQRSQEQVQQNLPPWGFDFRHLKVLRDIPLSLFYDYDIDNLDLPIQPLPHVGSFYGFDKESLAAENAALDEFYAKLRSGKAACAKGQSRGNKCTQDQSRNILCSESTSEEDDDIRTLRNLLAYKLDYGCLPYVLDQPTPTLGPQHPLLVYISYELLKGRCISESRLAGKVLKLQTKYKKLVAEKGKTPEHQDFSTPGDNIFFRLSSMTWEAND